MGQRIVIVAYDGVATLDITGPADVFTEAARQLGDGNAYRVELTSMGGGARRTTSGITVHSRDLARVRPRASDTVLVAGGGERALRAAVADDGLRRWLQHANGRVDRMGSVCSGVFVLATAGLLAGRRVATHWQACGPLANMFPDLSVDANAIYVNDGRLWTSAGVTTGIDMALAMVEHDHDAALADAVAAALVLYVRRPGFQSQFSQALIGQLERSDPLSQVTAWIRDHLEEADVERVAQAAGMSIRTLHRHCRDRLGLTPAKLIDRLRVEHATTLLSTTDALAKEVADQSGFGTVARMTRAFDRQLGVPPREYRLLHRRGLDAG